MGAPSGVIADVEDGAGGLLDEANARQVAVVLQGYARRQGHPDRGGRRCAVVAPPNARRFSDDDGNGRLDGQAVRVHYRNRQGRRAAQRGELLVAKAGSDCFQVDSHG